MNGKQGIKPRTYRRVMNKAFLKYSKKKKNARSAAANTFSKKPIPSTPGSLPANGR